MLQSTVDFLKANIDKLPAKDQVFTLSLIASYEKNKLSPKQEYWLGVMADKAKEGVKPTVGVDIAPAGDYSAIFTLFDSAKGNLKYPKIVLKLPDYEDGEQLGDGEYASKTVGGTLKLALAGPNSKYAGSIILTDGKPYGANKFYGTISKDKLNLSLKFKFVPKYVQDDILKLISGLAKEPLLVVKQWGVSPVKTSVPASSFKTAAVSFVVPPSALSGPTESVIKEVLLAHGVKAAAEAMNTMEAAAVETPVAENVKVRVLPEVKIDPANLPVKKRREYLF